jgi:DNA-binding MurR/RpiR family transcriptional regulator
MSALAKIRAERDGLSVTDRRIADFILANASLLRDYSSQQLADAIHVSQSSIVKFSQRLGYKGYPDLKLSVNEAVTRAAVVQETATGHLAAATDAHLGRSEPVWLAKTAAVRQTRDINDADTLATIATWIAGAETLILAGSGIEADAARSLADRITLLGRRSITCRQPAELLGSLSAAGRRDLLLVICGPGGGKEWVHGSREMRSIGGRVVAISRGRGGRITSVADAGLVVAAHDPQPHIEDLAYEAAMRHLLDDLFLSVLAAEPAALDRFLTNRGRTLGSPPDR